MGKKFKHKIIKTSKQIKVNVTNYTKNSKFFFDVTKIYPCIRKLDNISGLRLNEEEKNNLEEKIAILTFNTNKKKSNYKIINILPHFKEHLENMKLFDRTKTEYAKKIGNIIQEERSNHNKAITLSRIQMQYKTIYKKEISLVTISRILKNHLSLHFRRISIKNPKLNQKWYQFMHFLFLKGIAKGLKEGLEIIYLDETGCYLQNKNYYDWTGKNDIFIKGSEKNFKQKINIIAAIRLKEVLHYKILDSSVDSKNFGIFIDEIAMKLSDEEKRNALFVLDNASYHKTKEVIKKFKTYKLKVITNIPYKS